jgi:hypothetical protein
LCLPGKEGLAPLSSLFHLTEIVRRCNHTVIRLRSRDLPPWRRQAKHSRGRIFLRLDLFVYVRELLSFVLLLLLPLS